MYCTVLGDYVNTMKMTVLFKFFSNYKFTSNQREAFLIDSCS